jgi:spore germination protein YaaH
MSQTRTERRKEMIVHRKKRRVMWFLLLVFISSSVLFYFYGPDFFGMILTQREAPESYSIVYLDKPYLAEVLVRDGISFVPAEWFRDHIREDVEILAQDEKARWTPQTEEIRFTTSAVTDIVAREIFPVEFNLLSEEGKLYFPLSGAEKILGLQTEWHPETRILTIDSAKAAYQQGKVLRNTALKPENGWLQPKLAQLTDGETVRILEIHEGHYRVRTDQGLIGTLLQKDIGSIRRVEPAKRAAQLPSADPSVLSQPFGIVWDYVGNSHPDRSHESPINAVSVFSPTWFELKNDEGSLENRAQFRYARTMKSRGYQLWGLVTNAFDPDLTERFMQNEAGRRRFISQLLLYASLYELDGINIDFENMHFRNQDLFTGFMKELSENLRRQNLTVSIAVTIPGGSLNWSQVYDRRAIEPYVDYFTVMTYDEHWGSSPVAGSVASIGWVERGIMATLDEVPANKVLLGLPFYTRLWEEKQGSGGVTVSSRAMSMQLIRSLLEENGITRDDWIWNESAGQYYAEYGSNGSLYRVWLEDERSIELKSRLIEAHQLAGFAAWRKDFEMPEIWDVLELVLLQTGQR